MSADASLQGTPEPSSNPISEAKHLAALLKLRLFKKAGEIWED